MNDNTSQVIVFLLITFFVSFALYLSYKEDYIAMKNGYIQKVIDNKKVWVKANCKELNSKKD